MDRRDVLDSLESRVNEAIENATTSTVPGRKNEEIVESAVAAGAIVEQVVTELNNWFEVVEVFVYRDKQIGVPMRYRWTLKRWGVQDMDMWLRDRGWRQTNHLKADTDKRPEDHIEARYSKDYGEYTVHANFLVKFPDEYFEGGEDNVESTDATERVNEATRKKMKRQIEAMGAIEQKRNRLDDSQEATTERGDR